MDTEVRSEVLVRLHTRSVSGVGTAAGESAGPQETQVRTAAVLSVAVVRTCRALWVSDGDAVCA